MLQEQWQIFLGNKTIKGSVQKSSIIGETPFTSVHTTDSIWVKSIFVFKPII